MDKVLEKKERSLGIKLDIKGDRCDSPKCALTRKPYRPGQHGKKRRKISEYGSQLKEKQKVRFTYGLTERQLQHIFSEAAKAPEVTADEVTKILESRLDNIIFRVGLAPSRPSAKQLVGHGHFTVNGRKVTIPSMRLKIGDKIAVRAESKNISSLNDLSDKLKNYEIPSWLNMNKETLEVEVTGKPVDIPHPFDINVVVDYYS